MRSILCAIVNPAGGEGLAEPSSGPRVSTESKTCRNLPGLKGSGQLTAHRMCFMGGCGSEASLSGWINFAWDCLQSGHTSCLWTDRGAESHAKSFQFTQIHSPPKKSRASRGAGLKAQLKALSFCYFADQCLSVIISYFIYSTTPNWVHILLWGK